LHPLPIVIREIEPGEWSAFFESFTLQHARWLVEIDAENESMPLEGITARDGHIVITLGGDISHHRRITIDGRSVKVLETGGVVEGLAVESSDGHITRLRFRTAMPPELVDGV
jgi:hypothetical protein